MKKNLLLSFLLLLAGVFTFSSCLNDDDNDSSSQLYVDNVSISSSALSSSFYFIGSNGEIYNVGTNSTGSTNYQLMKTAYIQFTILSTDSSTNGKKIYNIDLKYAGSTLATVNRAESLATADSTKNDSIVEFKPFSVLNGKYLLLGINYYLYSRIHYMTLCYPNDNGFIKVSNASVPDTLRFYLHHNNNKDVASTTTSYQIWSTYPTLFYKTFDINDILSEAKMQNGGKNIYIDVVAKTQATSGGNVTNTHSGFVYKP